MKSLLMLFIFINIYKTVSTNEFSKKLPIVVLHGIASSKEEMSNFSSWITDTYNTEVYNVEIGNGYDTSLNTPLDTQVEMLCDLLDTMIELENGFNFIGMSQGGLIARAYVQRCNHPPVRNLITLVSPHGGEYDKNFNIIDFYNPLFQLTTSFAGYWRDPLRFYEYKTKCSFLPDINIDKPVGQQLKYKFNLLKLYNFVMIWSPSDEIIKPSSSGKFDVYDREMNVVDLTHSELYINDYLGLKKLNETNRLWSFQTTCKHVEHKMPYCHQQLKPILDKFL